MNKKVKWQEQGVGGMSLDPETSAMTDPTQGAALFLGLRFRMAFLFLELLASG